MRATYYATPFLHSRENISRHLKSRFPFLMYSFEFRTFIISKELPIIKQDTATSCFSCFHLRQSTTKKTLTIQAKATQSPNTVISNNWGKRNQNDFWRKLEKLNPTKKQFDKQYHRLIILLLQSNYLILIWIGNCNLALV